MRWLWNELNVGHPAVRGCQGRTRDVRPRAFRKEPICGQVRGRANRGTEAPTPGEALALVEEYRDKLEKLSADQGDRLTLEKGATRRTSGER